MSSICKHDDSRLVSIVTINIRWCSCCGALGRLKLGKWNWFTPEDTPSHLKDLKESERWVKRIKLMEKRAKDAVSVLEGK